MTITYNNNSFSGRLPEKPYGHLAGCPKKKKKYKHTNTHTHTHAQKPIDDYFRSKTIIIAASLQTDRLITTRSVEQYDFY